MAVTEHAATVAKTPPVLAAGASLATARESHRCQNEGHTDAPKRIGFVSSVGPTERTNKDRELQEVGFTDAANYGVPQVCSLPRSH